MGGRWARRASALAGAHTLGQPPSPAGLSGSQAIVCCMFGTGVPALLCPGKSDVTSGLQSRPALAVPPRTCHVGVWCLGCSTQQPAGEADRPPPL